jgi:hypothetical protein
MPAPPVPERYLLAGAGGGAAPPRRGLLRSYTCLVCGSRHASWAALRAHRGACGATRPSPIPADAAEAPQEVVWPAGARSTGAGPEATA